MKIKVCKNKFEHRVSILFTGTWFAWNLSVIPSIIYVAILFNSDFSMGRTIDTIMVINALFGGMFTLILGVMTDTIFHVIVRKQKLFEWRNDC